MQEQPSLEEFAQALQDLPPEYKAQLASIINPQEEIDTVAIKLELVKFVTELQKHNQGVEWETNKVLPKQIKIDKIIGEATQLFEFITQ